MRGTFCPVPVLLASCTVIRQVLDLLRAANRLGNDKYSDRSAGVRARKLVRLPVDLRCGGDEQSSRIINYNDLSRHYVWGAGAKVSETGRVAA
jgi:hypothetical protein